MNLGKRNPRLGILLLLTGVALALEAGWWRHARKQMHHGLAALELIKQERDRLARQSPALSEENEEAVNRTLAGAEEKLANGRAIFPTDDPPNRPDAAPVKAVDAYVELAAFVERTRGLAARAQVMTRPDERFGFASHANQGPAAELAPTVCRQRSLLQLLMEQLIEARPHAVLAVQRERPKTAAQKAGRHQPGAAGNSALAPAGDGGQSGDFFEFDERTSLRVPGLLDSEAFRIEFSGQTDAARRFLTGLASGKLPLIVRRVEAEPLTSGSTPARAGALAIAGAPVLLVAPDKSRFSIVVEVVGLVTGSERRLP